MRSFYSILAIFLISLMSRCVNGTEINADCSTLIVKESEGVLNWLGNVTITVPVTTGPDGWTMTIAFDQIFTGLGVWDVTTQNFGNDKYALLFNKPENAVLKTGDRFSFRFRINYGQNIPQPKAISLKFFDIELCK